MNCGSMDMTTGMTRRTMLWGLTVLGVSTMAYAASRPDLIVSAMGIPSTARAGDTISVSYTVRNQGPPKAGASTLACFLVRSGVSSVSLGTIPVGSINRNATRSGRLTVSIPANTAPGEYAVRLIADIGHMVTESNESNNSADRSISITAGGVGSEIPQLALWESHMLRYGQQHSDWWATNQNATIDDKLNHLYYDQARVFYQIADYTDDTSWHSKALAPNTFYRDSYVLPNDGNIPGYWNFTTGLRLNYERTGSQASKNAAILLSQRMYAADYTPLEYTANATASREVAYAILSYINAEALGEAPRSRRAAHVTQAYDHMTQWFVTQAWAGTPDQFSPFMVGLTAHSLIRDWEQTGDSRLIPALQGACDYLWADAWVPADQAMRYQLNPDNVSEGGRSTGGAPDLNLLIAPMYAFLYAQTGSTTARDRGDQLFAGGVTGAFLDHGKQFDQNYWWSFDYVEWRTA